MRFAAFRLKGKFYLLGLGILSLSFAGSCESSAQTAPHDTRSIATSKYETLKARVTGDDLSVDWAEFRAVATTAGLDSYDWHATRQRVLNDLGNGNLTAALSGAQTVIAHNMANPEGHLLAMTVYQQMGMEPAADRERRIVDAIVTSIMASGDGLSVQHALSTVSSSEEEFVVNMVLDADTESQTIVLADGRTYNRRTVRTEDGSERVLWFNATPQQHATVAAITLPTR